MEAAARNLSPLSVTTDLGTPNDALRFGRDIRGISSSELEVSLSGRCGGFFTGPPSSLSSEIRGGGPSLSELVSAVIEATLEARFFDLRAALAVSGALFIGAADVLLLFLDGLSR